MINSAWENFEVLLEEVILSQALKDMKEVTSIRWRTVKRRNKMQGLRKK